VVGIFGFSPSCCSVVIIVSSVGSWTSVRQLLPTLLQGVETRLPLKTGQALAQPQPVCAYFRNRTKLK
jgi:hypothetical protein